jgi:ABC-2 type transport system permease protein
MSHARDVYIVAQWEFRRFFKWKDQAISLALFLLVSGVWAGAALVAGASGRTVTIALAGIEVPAPAGGRLQFVPAAPDDRTGTDALRRGDVQGVLSRRSDGAFELLVTKDPRYRTELMVLLEEVVRRERLSASGVSSQALQRILAPVAFDVRFTNPARERQGRAEKIAAGVCIGVMLIAVFISLANLLTGITGEKQLRVTESVVSAISPQAWIDGKVFGITATALASVANLIVGMAIVAVTAQFASGFTWPVASLRPGVVFALAVYTVLGLLLWNAFFAAVAATVSDVYTSSRSSLVFLPLVPVVLSIAVLRDPDALVARILALFPLTSAPALPMRLVLSDPGLVEVSCSLALLAGAVWVMRRMAGRIFELGILLYGKEPTLPEMMRWAIERRAR